MTAEDAVDRQLEREITDWLHSPLAHIKDALHRRLHRDRPECPRCADWQKKADDWAHWCVGLEALLSAEQAKREVAPGTRVLGGIEVGGVHFPVADAEFAVASDTLLTGQKPRLPQPVAPELPSEPPDPLPYERVVAMQKPKGEAVIDPVTMRDIRDRAEEGRTWWPNGRPVNALCHRRDGKPAITTAEITARVREA